MLTAYKTEIQPTLNQQQKIDQTIGVARWVSNEYIAKNQEQYKKDQSFISGRTFSKWLNNEFIPNNPDYAWIKEVSSKSTKQAIMNTEKAFKSFFKGLSSYPKFKKKAQQKTKLYFVKNDAKHVIQSERHRIKVPTLGWVKLKEKGYIPTHDDQHMIKSGTISKQADRYYVSVLVEQSISTASLKQTPSAGIGVDLGLKDFAVFSDGMIYKNNNKSVRIKKLERKLKREQRVLSRKYEAEKTRITQKQLKKGESTRKNVCKQLLKVQKLHQTLADIRQDYQNKIVASLVRTKPAYITIEDLNIRGMMKNRHLSKAISKQGFYTFRTKLQTKATQHQIELRLVSRWYPSSKTCHTCKAIKKDLKLNDRVFLCPCGYSADRDLNAAYNLRDASIYEVIA
ncbi:transposase [Carnobacterium alterfunditum]|uniref:Transposase n=1 Tax=Carnobacterium alterfunditum TaxID=28230 RepID=A0A1N6HQR9_9LACT|nr:RNA-guided endonuclease TnpB family protein [Carnobacterium alterfunditum]SIO22056.1 transposase [Carnobacterium alterfunditum]